MTRLTLCGLMGLVAAIACGDDAAGGAGSGGSGGSGGTGAGDTVEITGTMNEFQLTPGADPKPVAGVEVCELDSDNCAKTDAKGVYTLQVKPDTQGALTFTKTGYQSVLSPGTAPSEDGPGPAPVMVPDAINTLFRTMIEAMTGKPDDPKLGVLSIATFTMADPDVDAGGAALFDATGAKIMFLPGVSFKLTKGTAGTGPVYVGKNSLPDTSLTATTEGGFAVYALIEPGEVEIKLSGVSTCEVAAGWKASAALSVRAPVKAGFLTQAAMNCE